MFIVSTSSKEKEEVPSILEEKTEIEVESVKTDVAEEVQLIDTVSEEVIVPSFEGDENDSAIENPVDDRVVLVEFVPDVDEIPVIEVPTEEPVVEMSEEISIPDVQDEVSVEEMSTIETVSEEVEHRPIYGGADPLEATQKLPQIDIHYEPYSGGSEVQEVTVVEEESNDEPVFTINEEVEPIVDESQNIEIPIIDDTPVIESSSIEEQVEDIPEIVAIPDEEIEQL